MILSKDRHALLVPQYENLWCFLFWVCAVAMEGKPFEFFSSLDGKTIFMLANRQTAWLTLVSNLVP